MPKLFRVVLQVHEIEAATLFYQQLLGVDGKRVSPGRHYFDCEGTILACFDPKADGDDFSPKSSVDFIYIAVNDIQATYTSAIAARAEMEEGNVAGAAAGRIERRPWGERSFYCKDPFGNRLCLVESSTTFVG